FAKPAWLICIFELCFGSGQSGSQKNILFLHCRDQLVVDIAVTDAADKSINPGLDQIFCVGQLENFGNNLQIPLVCFVDGGAINAGLNLCPFPIAVIDPELDGINLLFRQLRHGFPSVSGSGYGNRNIAESGGSSASGHNSSSS